MPYTALSDAAPLIAVLQTAAYSSSSVTTGYVNMGLYTRAMFVVNINAVGSGESVTATVKQATTSTGAGAKAANNPISLSSAITASNQQAVVNVNGQSMDANNGFQWAALTLTFVNSGTTAGAETSAGVNVFGDPDITPPTSVAGQVVGAGVTSDY